MRSEGRIAGELEPGTATGGLPERKVIGVEHEARCAGGIAVERVAEDRAAEPAVLAWRGGVHAKLVRAAGHRPELDARSPVEVIPIDHAPQRSRRLAALMVDDLSRAIRPVDNERQIYRAFIALDEAIEQRDV